MSLWIFSNVKSIRCNWYLLVCLDFSSRSYACQVSGQQVVITSQQVIANNKLWHIMLPVSLIRTVLWYRGSLSFEYCFWSVLWGLHDKPCVSYIGLCVCSCMPCVHSCFFFFLHCWLDLNNFWSCGLEKCHNILQLHFKAFPVCLVVMNNI